MHMNRLLLGALVVLAGLTAATPASATDPATDGLVEVNGTELYVKRVGSGEPIVIVHGGPVMDHSYFLPHLYPLSDRYELIFYDQRASGRSVAEVDSESMRMATFVDDIEGLRAALDLGPIHVLGHSWGGLLAMRAAIRGDVALRSLILVSPMPASAERWQEEEMANGGRITPEDTADRAALRETEGFASGESATLAALLRLSFRPQFHDPGNLSRLNVFVPDDYVARSTTYGALMPDLMQFDHHDALAAVTVPTLIVYGDAEPGADIGGAAIHDRILGSRFVRIPEAGHFSFVEQRERFLREVRRFLVATEEGDG
jgi:proline iminopeptidase